MTPKSTYESNKVSDRVGALAGVMSSAMRKLNALLGPARATVMLLNQVRVKMGVMFGDNTTTPGGNAPKFYASVRLQFFGGDVYEAQRRANRMSSSDVRLRQG